MKKQIIELANIIKEKGYWSEEVKEILSKYDRTTAYRMEITAKIYNETGVYKLQRV